MALIRVQMWLEQRGLSPFARVVRYWNHVLNGIDWVNGAVAGPGLVLRHPSGTVIGGRTVIGKNVTILQNVTIGQAAFKAGEDDSNPVLCDDVTVGASAIVLGAVSIGMGAVVGAAAVVLRDVPAYSTVVGSPARVIRGHVVEEKQGGDATASTRANS